MKTIQILKVSLLMFALLTKATAESSTSKIENSSLEPSPIGNFVLPTAQQPGPFFSFGQNIIGKNQLQFFLMPTYLQDTGEHFWEIDPYLLYGLTDTASLLLSLPAAVDYESGGQHSSGLADASVQLEYAFYQASSSKYTIQATVVGAMSVPTGSFNKSPPTGYGVPSYFIGGTYNQTYMDWLWFVSPGVLWISPNKRIHLGSQYLYQLGIGKNLNTKASEYILLGLLEFDGEFDEKNTILGKKYPNSGGNIIYLTPSLWFSTQKLIVQFGVSWPVFQRWNGAQRNTNHSLTPRFRRWSGNQSDTEYYAMLSLAWTLN